MVFGTGTHSGQEASPGKLSLVLLAPHHEACRGDPDRRHRQQMGEADRRCAPRGRRCEEDVRGGGGGEEQARGGGGDANRGGVAQGWSRRSAGVVQKGGVSALVGARVCARLCEILEAASSTTTIEQSLFQRADPKEASRFST